MTDAANALAAFIIVRASSYEAAARMFERHPDFTLFPGDAVEVMPLVVGGRIGQRIARSSQRKLWISPSLFTLIEIPPSESTIPASISFFREASNVRTFLQL